jgi:hypothetical protein
MRADEVVFVRTGDCRGGNSHLGARSTTVPSGSSPISSTLPNIPTNSPSSSDLFPMATLNAD